MGNRAVIVADDVTNKNKKERCGIYLHWHGGRKTVENFLQIAKDREIRSLQDDEQYALARLCQIIGEYLSKEEGDDTASLGVGIVSQLDCNNFDNGVYYIDKNYNIVKQTSGEELEKD